METLATAPARVPWGIAELFVISQTAIPAILFIPGTQSVRLYVRIAAFVVSLVILAWWRASKKTAEPPHPARSWLIGIMVLLSVMIAHPQTNSLLAALAQIILYAAIMAPAFWAPSFVRGPDHLARLLALFLVCNGLNATVGVLQVYDPERWMPPEFSHVMTGSKYGMDTVTYIGPNGVKVVRPPGLFDYPGAVAGPAMYATLLGLVFGISALAPWKRVLAIGLSFAGIAAIYLTQVRVSLVVGVAMVAAYAALLLLQERKGRAVVFGGTALFLLLLAFSFALGLGGQSIESRTLTLLQEGPVKVYTASRGTLLVTTFSEVLVAYPLGAGLGNWGMVAGYFASANPFGPKLWAELDLTGWAIDGGFPLLTLYGGALLVTLVAQARHTFHHPDAKTRACAAVVLAAGAGTVALVFSYTPFASQTGMQFWFLAGALHGVAVRTGRPMQ